MIERIRIQWKCFKDKFFEVRKRPFHLKPYAYLIPQTVVPLATAFIIWPTILNEAWSLFFDVWPKHSLLEAGWMGSFVVALLLAWSFIALGLKLIGLVHLRALADRIYWDNCPSSR